MNLLEVVRQVRRHLEESGRVSYRMLRRQFDLEDEALEELIEELVDVQGIARRETNALAWSGTPSSHRAEGTPERSPRDYTPKHLADKILQSKSALEGERKQVTVLFADVKGSMELAEHVDPEEWHRILDRFFQILADGVHRFEGTINQYTGDGIMALFGAPIAHEDHAQRACYTALHLREELRCYAQELKREKGLGFSVRMGLNSGEVVVGKIGDDLRMDYTAQGHTVGLAARMQELASPDTVYLSDHSAALVSGYFDLKDLGDFTLKGVREPVRVRELRDVGQLRTRFDVARARGLSKFVGRDREMTALDAALEGALEGQGQVVGVVAEAGTGKSRLCFEFAKRCRVRGIMVREARGVVHGRSIPFLLVFELMRGYFGITQQDSDEMARDKIAGRVVRLDPGLSEELPIVFDFLGVPDPGLSSPSLSPEAYQRQLFGIVRRLIQARSERQPAVFVFEDLHWIDGASEAFVENQVESIAGTRTLLLVNFRPEYHAPWMQKSYYQQLPLLPLGAEAIGELLVDLLGSDPSLANLGERLRERTGGNPFFIEELVQALVESKTLVGSRDAYRLSKPFDDATIPPTVQAVLAARIDRLSEREKQVLQTAAVIGRTFSEALLARVVAMQEVELAEALRALIGAEFLYEEALYPEREYSFKHPLTQEVAYQSQLRERRARIHAIVAHALEELHRDKLDEQAALLAHHWERAEDPLCAARWHRRAAVWAGYSHAAEAVRHWQRVRALLKEVPESPEVLALGVEAHGQIILTNARLGSGSQQEAEELFAEAKELAARSGDLRSAALIHLHYAFSSTLLGRITKGRELAEEAHRLAEETGDADLRAAGVYVLVVSAFNAGACNAALSLCEQGLALIASDPQLGSEVFGYPLDAMFLMSHARALGLSGRLEESTREFERARAAASERQPASLVTGHCAYLWLGDLVGDPATAMACARQSAEIANRIGIGLLDTMAELSLGLALLLNGQDDEAAQVLGHGLREAREHGLSFLEAMRLIALARAHLARGDLSSARAVATEAVALAGDRGDYGASAFVVLGQVLLQAEGAKARSEIEAALTGAQRLVDASGACSRQPFIHEVRAELARCLGDEATWGSELREAHRLFTEMGASGHAERVARELRL